MKVELKIDPNCQEPWAVINVAKLTPSLQAAITILEKECEEMIFTAQNNGKIYIIDPVKIELIRTEGRELALYDLKKERYVLNKPLYEVQEKILYVYQNLQSSILSVLIMLKHLLMERWK